MVNVGRGFSAHPSGSCINPECKLFESITYNHYCTVCGSRTTVPNRTTGKVEPKIKVK
jgi:hypothetical protein